MLERDFGITNYLVLQDSDLLETELENDNPANYLVAEVKTAKRADALNQYNQLWQHIASKNEVAVQEAFDSEYLKNFLAVSQVFSSGNYAPDRKIDLVFDFTRGKFLPYLSMSSCLLRIAKPLFD